MSPRARSWLGGILFSVGVFAFFTGALFPGLYSLVYVGGGVVLLGLGFVGWALRDVGRQIEGNHARFEALLRVEAERDKKSPPPPDPV